MKPRILIISAVIPALDRGGGCLALHRHFVERDDFDFAVASMYPLAHAKFTQFRITRFSISSFLRAFRFFRLGENINCLLADRAIPRGLLDFASEWRPAVVFSVVDDFHTPIAAWIARSLNVPLVVNFQDLFAYSRFLPKWQRPYCWLLPRLISRYRRIQAEAAGVLYTSLGMKQWFGGGARGQVLYPLGESVSNYRSVNASLAGRYKIVYAGNCYGPYGRMILRLAQCLEGHPKWDFEIYTMGSDWPEEAVEGFKTRGVYCGYLPFPLLRERLGNAHLLLTAMSFECEDRIFMETSFTTKVVDYLQFGKPIMVWAPNYSTAARFASSTGAALLVEEPNPEKVRESLERFVAEGSLAQALLVAAEKAANGDFNVERIHGVLKQTFRSVIEPYSAKWVSFN